MTGIGGVINGMMPLVLVVAALPALMKLLSPATAAMGSGAGGAMATAAGAAAVRWLLRLMRPVRAGPWQALLRQER